MTETGLPVVVDFYSDSCGPCRMMAPIFKKVAGDLVDKAVFVKIDTNQQYELSQRFQVRSLPTFMWFVGDTKGPIQVEKGGIGEGPLRQYTNKAMRQAESENVVLEWESFVEYYKEMDPAKSEEELKSLYDKCAKKIKGSKGQCVGSSAAGLMRKLKKKYKKAPPTKKRFEPSETSKKSDDEAGAKKEEKPKQRRASGANSAPNLHLATKEQLQAELEKRLDEERDAQVDAEGEDEDESDPDFKRWSPGAFPQPVGTAREQISCLDLIIFLRNIYYISCSQKGDYYWRWPCGEFLHSSGEETIQKGHSTSQINSVSVLGYVGGYLCSKSWVESPHHRA